MYYNYDTYNLYKLLFINVYIYMNILNYVLKYLHVACARKRID